MPLSPQEAVTAVKSIISQVPKLVRWRKLDRDQKQAVIEAIGDALAQLCLDILD